jgi:hypothetical protein
MLPLCCSLECTLRYTKGIDDILALLLAFASQDAEVLLVSLTFGNVEVKRWVTPLLHTGSDLTVHAAVCAMLSPCSIFLKEK